MSVELSIAGCGNTMAIGGFVPLMKALAFAVLFMNARNSVGGNFPVMQTAQFLAGFPSPSSGCSASYGGASATHSSAHSCVCAVLVPLNLPQLF